MDLTQIVDAVNSFAGTNANSMYDGFIQSLAAIPIGALVLKSLDSEIKKRIDDDFFNKTNIIVYGAIGAAAVLGTDAYQWLMGQHNIFNSDLGQVLGIITGLSVHKYLAEKPSTQSSNQTIKGTN